MLAVIVLMIDQELRKRNAGADRFSEDVEQWKSAAMNSGPGLIEIDLSGKWESAEGNELLLRVLDDVTKALEANDRTVSRSFLQGLGETSFTQFKGDVDVQRVLDDLEKWKLLLEGRGDDLQ